MLKRAIREEEVGVTPEEFDLARQFELCKSLVHDDFIVHKASKKGQNSFRITKALLESLFETQSKIQKTPKLIISILDDSFEYTITCSITKTKR